MKFSVSWLREFVDLPKNAEDIAELLTRAGVETENIETRGAKIPAELKNRDLTQPNGPNEQIQREILKLYKSSPEISILFELMTDFDEGLQEWRYRHIKLVERTIGAKKGTGGSPGVPFLKESLFKPVFHDLWAIRHEL